MATGILSVPTDLALAEFAAICILHLNTPYTVLRNQHVCGMGVMRNECIYVHAAHIQSLKHWNNNVSYL